MLLLARYVGWLRKVQSVGSAKCGRWFLWGSGLGKIALLSLSIKNGEWCLKSVEFICYLKWCAQSVKQGKITHLGFHKNEHLGVPKGYRCSYFSKRYCQALLTWKSSCIIWEHWEVMANPWSSSQNEGYSSKWLVWLVVCREPLTLCWLNFQCKGSIKLLSIQFSLYISSVWSYIQ